MARTASKGFFSASMAFSVLAGYAYTERKHRLPGLDLNQVPRHRHPIWHTDRDRREPGIAATAHDAPESFNLPVTQVSATLLQLGHGIGARGPSRAHPPYSAHRYRDGGERASRMSVMRELPVVLKCHNLCSCVVGQIKTILPRV